MISDELTPVFTTFIVDDSPILIERLSAILNDLRDVVVLGYATNISAALCAIHDQRPDAVILDIYLKEDAPSANGMDLLLILRNSYPAMLIIMLTNISQPHYRKNALNPGPITFSISRMILTKYLTLL